MGRKPKFTAKQVAEAIRESRGFLTVAAKQLGCTRQTLYKYIRRYKVVREALEDAREEMKDLAELRLFRTEAIRPSSR